MFKSSYIKKINNKISYKRKIQNLNFTKKLSIILFNLKKNNGIKSSKK